MRRRLAVLLATVLSAGPASAAETDGPLALTRSVLTRSNEIVRGRAERKDKLVALSELLRGFLDTEALADRAAQGASTGS